MLSCEMYINFILLISLIILQDNKFMGVFNEMGQKLLY